MSLVINATYVVSATLFITWLISERKNLTVKRWPDILGVFIALAVSIIGFVSIHSSFKSYLIAGVMLSIAELALTYFFNDNVKQRVLNKQIPLLVVVLVPLTVVLFWPLFLAYQIYFAINITAYRESRVKLNEELDEIARVKKLEEEEEKNK